MTNDGLESSGSDLPTGPRPNHPNLPWVIGGGALLFLLCTLNPWITSQCLPVTARVLGWEWQLSYTQPLYHLATLPVRILPTSWQIVGLNVFSAVCAALTLALLARAVMLLPQDRTREQRQRQTDGKGLLRIDQAWVPPLLAAGVLAFQITFWENATVASAEMLDLLVFAYIVRCLLEFRISGNDNWLTRLAFVYGLGVTNNWALIAYFPVFLGAVAWLKGLRFFQPQFLTGLLLAGLAGLTLYFLLPAMAALNSTEGVTFFTALKSNLAQQKLYLTYFWSQRFTILLLGLSSLFPALIISVRWPSLKTDPSAAGQFLSRVLFQVLHLSLFGICLWVFFDHALSPRVKGGGFASFLTFYFLSALCAGYFSGYFLLTFAPEPDRTWSRPSALAAVAARTAIVVVTLGAIAVPTALWVRNRPPLQITNGPALREFALLTTRSLPASGAVILGDDASRLHLLKAVWQAEGHQPDHVLLVTSALTNTAYHKALQRSHPKISGAFVNRSPVEDVDLVKMLERLSGLNRSIFYLHSSFGYYFERFYAHPNGLVNELTPYPKGLPVVPALPPADFEKNKAFWTPLVTGVLPGLARSVTNNVEAYILGGYYSRAVDQWGVELQKRRLLPEAGEFFSLALRLHPDNAIARVNQEFNAGLRAGRVIEWATREELARRIAPFTDFPAAVLAGGPPDDVSVTLLMGQLLAIGGNVAQSVQNFQRVLELSPNHVEARLSLIKNYIELQNPDLALQGIAQVRANSAKFPPTADQNIDLLNAESLAHVAKQDLPGAEKIILRATQSDSRNPAIWGLLADFYAGYAKQWSNALAATEQQLRLVPTNVNVMRRQGVLQMNIGAYDQAVASFTTALKQRTNDLGLVLNRAICLLQAGHLDEARRDYETIARALPKPVHQVHYGLGEIAWRKKDRPEALRQYEIYLQNAPSVSQGQKDEIKSIQTRVAQLKAGQGW